MSTGMTAVRWAVQGSNRAALTRGGRGSNQPSGLLLSPRFPENWECLPRSYEPDSLRERVRVRFLFIGGFEKGLLGP